MAERGSACLCADLGITPEPREDHAAYLAHWIAVLKDDKRAIFAAAAHAPKAVDYLDGLQANAKPVPCELGEGEADQYALMAMRREAATR